MAYIISRPWGGQCGVGHQFHNWLTGHLLASYYGLTFVHSPFCGNGTWFQTDVPVKQWEKFLGFGRGFITETQLPPNIKRIVLPRVTWDETTWYTVTCDHPAWKNIIEQYRDKDVLFECTRDQFVGLGWQHLDVNKLRENYWYARLLWPITSNFDQNKINVAIHIRRGDVTERGRYKIRWVADYVYQNVVNQLRMVHPGALFHIYSDSTRQDMSGFQNDDTILHLKENVFETFHHMVIADILVTGQSMFSALSGHLCNNIRVVRSWSPHWSNFPVGQKFIEVNQNGNFNLEQLRELM